MPPSETVEKALDPALNAWFGVADEWDRKREDVERADLMERMRRTLRAALAAMTGAEPVAWQYLDPHDKTWEDCTDPEHFRNELGWQVRALFATPPVALKASADEIAASQEENRRLREALADAIRRPMGVIPDSAVGLITPQELDAAEQRRP
jgi:hypothetical protein